MQELKVFEIQQQQLEEVKNKYKSAFIEDHREGLAQKLQAQEFIDETRAANAQRLQKMQRYVHELGGCSVMQINAIRSVSTRSSWTRR